MDINKHIVDFGTYCQNCKYFEKEDHKDPCHTCLSIPTNENSRKPLYFELKPIEKKDNKKKKKK